MHRLECDIQEYDWGDPSFIPSLLGRPASGRPQAELWIGAHPAAPSRLAEDGRSLADLIVDDPVDVLGPCVAERFAEMPFLAKVLAADRPLSIQTHPNLVQAEMGFNRESDAGIALDAPNRVYRDRNHKPEVIVALTPFEAKCGFRDLSATRDLFGSLGDRRLDEIRARLDAPGAPGAVLASTVRWLLADLSPVEVERLVAAVVETAAACEFAGPFRQDLAWVAPMHELFGNDVGVVVSLLLNHVVLEPGEAMFLGAGTLHAYLRGAGFEVMANSDNVIRGGLTSKHIDSAELLDVVSTEPTTVAVQRPRGDCHEYSTPVPEFSVARIVVDGVLEMPAPYGPEVLVAVDGDVEVRGRGQRHPLAAGEPLFVSGSEPAYVMSGSGLVLLARAGRCLAARP